MKAAGQKKETSDAMTENTLLTMNSHSSGWLPLYWRYSVVVYHSRKMGRKEMQEGVSQARMIIRMAVLTVIREW